ncbi:MAG: HAD-IA family hydrolase [Rhodobacteraceae bacterium]|nr:HAD-IA family hydrolase [Paracoccaceae bacterium]
MARRLAVFDIDGTLVDSQDQIVAAMTHAFDVTGHVLPERTQILSIVGLSLPEAIARLVPAFPADEQDAIVTAYKHGFGQSRARLASPMFPGMRDLIDDLARVPGMILGVATGKSRRGLDHIIDAHGLAARFETQQVADDHPSKPHPSMLLRALAETAVPPENAVMIGDTTFDIEMGRAAGMHTIGVGWGYHDAGMLRDAGAGQIVMTAEALFQALTGKWEKA